MGDINRFRTYEDFMEYINGTSDADTIKILKVQYAILFRRWEKVKELINIEYRDTKTLAPVLHEKQSTLAWEQMKECTILNLLRYNEDKICAYSEKNEMGQDDTLSEIVTKLLSDANKVGCPLFTYDETITGDGRSLFEVFFPYSAPLLGVRKYDVQLLPSKQVWKNGCSLVMDEVGTGKTISAIYAIARTIEEAIGENREARILIVCPSNLRSKWEEDIRDNLGRYSHKMNRGEQTEGCYDGMWKLAYFREKEHCIFLIDNIACKGESKIQIWGCEGYKKIPWDLIVIDEGHLCQGNYDGLRGRRAMILTATPVVQYFDKSYSNENSPFDSYRNSLSKIISPTDITGKEIDPINKVKPTEDDIFTNHFREDLKEEPTRRDIIFVTAKRMEKYDEAVTKIREKKGHWLVADHYAQDDAYLAHQYKQIFGESIDVADNDKRKCLQKDIIETLEEEHKNNKSKRPAIIIFCEHVWVADSIWRELKDTSGRIVALKCGELEIIGDNKIGNLIDTLHQYIRKGEETVILVITGKTGGTGLNMGDFDAVVHYEMPYTSILLEQRFGRIDRMSERKTGPKKMYFILDEERNENRANRNRLFWFCVTKLDITCHYLPVRNTVLFYPNLMEMLQKRLLSLLRCMKLFVSDDVFDDRYKDIKVKYDESMKKVEGIWEESKKKSGEKEGENSLFKWKYYTNPEKLPEGDDKKAIIDLKKVVSEKEKYENAAEEFEEFIRSFPIIYLLCDDDKHQVDIDSVFVPHYEENEEESCDEKSCYPVNDDALEKAIFKACDAHKENVQEKTQSKTMYQEQYNEIKKMVENININRFKDKDTSGVFYYKERLYPHQSVDDFRRNKQ